CELVEMCDIVLAAENAMFGHPEVRVGTMPGAGGTQRLPRLLGMAKALDLLLTGRRMDASEAERSGLVSRIVPPDHLLEEGRRLAAD
ncbi:enoyl-CoA hydratase-related protein, partial [Pseudomonas aeruginosa]